MEGARAVERDVGGVGDEDDGLSLGLELLEEREDLERGFAVEVAGRLVGEEQGGWNDFYGFLTRLPHWIPLTAIMPLTFLIATGIRVLHNRSYDRRKAEEAACFTSLFADADVRKIVAAMARSHSSAKILDIVIPSRIITIMLEHSKSDCTLEEACEIYLKEYMENCAVLDLEKYWI